MVDSHKHCPYNMIKVYAGTWWLGSASTPKQVQIQIQIKTQFTDIQGTKELKKLQEFNQIFLWDGPPHVAGWVWADKQ